MRITIAMLLLVLVMGCASDEDIADCATYCTGLDMNPDAVGLCRSEISYELVKARLK